MKYKIKVLDWRKVDGSLATSEEIDRHKARAHCEHAIYPTKRQADSALAWISLQFKDKEIAPRMEVEKA